MNFQTFSTFCFVVLMTGCGPSFNEALREMKPSDDPTYGYIAANPILIGYYDPIESIRATEFFLASLRTSAWNRYSYSRIGSFDAGTIEGYSIVDQFKRDTVVLYFDIYTPGPLQIPKGLKWEELK